MWQLWFIGKRSGQLMAFGLPGTLESRQSKAESLAQLGLHTEIRRANEKQ